METIAPTEQNIVLIAPLGQRYEPGTERSEVTGSGRFVSLRSRLS